MNLTVFDVREIAAILAGARTKGTSEEIHEYLADHFYAFVLKARPDETREDFYALIEEAP